MENTLMRRTPSRRNPITFDNRIPLTPELRERIRASKARVAASTFSPAKHRAIEKATANSPHNFRVVIEPDPPYLGADTWLEHRKGQWRDVVRPDAVTLVSTWDLKYVRDAEVLGDPSKAARQGIFTAFTYLHRLGDHLASSLLLPWAFNKPWVFNKDAIISRLGSGYLLEYTDAFAVAAHRAHFARFVAMARENNVLLRRVAADIKRYDVNGKDLLLRYIETHVNSKMVREGYSSDIDQSLADLFPLCEFTPASRPLFLPFDEARMAMAYPSWSPWTTAESDPESDTNWKRSYPAEVAAACSAYGEEMNVRFRELYNTLIPALYGSVWVI